MRGFLRFATTALVVIDVIHPYGQGAAFGARRYVTLTPFLILGTAGAAAWLVGNQRHVKPGLALIGGHQPFRARLNHGQTLAGC